MREVFLLNRKILKFFLVDNEILSRGTVTPVTVFILPTKCPLLLNKTNQKLWQ